MNKITLLPEEVANKIAAGEVIERPASIVKELVENSIDSGAKQIKIEIHNAGIDEIKVTDDGCGITEEDLPLSIMRHGTSKILKLSDLSNINSLGFRGEALSSISAISELKIIESGSILIGKGISLSLNVKVGDKVYLQCISQKQSLSNIPIIKSFIVRDVFYSGLQEYDNSLVYISLNDSRSILSLQEDQVSGLIFFEQKFIPDGRVEYPFYFETWKEKHALLFEWISIQRWPAYMIFSLIAVVGLVNLIAAIAMIIIEKTNQIGILITQGLPYSAIKNIFMMQGSFIGLCGGFFGGCLAAALIFIQIQYEILKIPSDIYFMDHIPVSFDYIIFLGALIISLLLSLLASWFPVRKIASLNTANALRYE